MIEKWLQAEMFLEGFNELSLKLYITFWMPQELHGKNSFKSINVTFAYKVLLPSSGTDMII